MRIERDWLPWDYPGVDRVADVTGARCTARHRRQLLPRAVADCDTAPARRATAACANMRRCARARVAHASCRAASPRRHRPLLARATFNRT